MTPVGAALDPIPYVLEAMMCNLSHWPCHQVRLCSELHRVLQEQGGMDIAMVSTLPFLNAVVQETLRMVTITTIQTYQPRLGPFGGCMIHGFSLPEKTVMESLPFLRGNYPALFPEPQIFNPDRWLVEEEAYHALEQHLSQDPYVRVGRELATASKYHPVETVHNR